MNPRNLFFGGGGVRERCLSLTPPPKLPVSERRWSSSVDYLCPCMNNQWTHLHKLFVLPLAICWCEPKATLELKNVSGASRQLRVVPLSSPHFSISSGKWCKEVSSGFLSVFFPRVGGAKWDCMDYWGDKYVSMCKACGKLGGSGACSPGKFWFWTFH